MYGTIEAFDSETVGATRLQALLGPDVEPDHRPSHQPADSGGDDPLRRRIARDPAGEVIGYSAVHRARWRPPGEWQVEVFVHPEHRRQGVGSALVDDLLARSGGTGMTSLLAEVQGRHPDFVAFAAHRGFAEVQRFVTMRRRLDDIDPDALRQAAMSRAPGYRLFSFADTGQGPEASRKLYELNRRLAPLIPGNGEEFPTFAEFQVEILSAGWFRPEAQLIAALEDTWVGLVGLGWDPVRRQASHEFSAVDPLHQGKGVGQALKMWGLALAKSTGAVEIVTGNDHSNAAIIAVNTRLGYTTEPGVVRMRRLTP